DAEPELEEVRPAEGEIEHREVVRQGRAAAGDGLAMVVATLGLLRLTLLGRELSLRDEPDVDETHLLARAERDALDVRTIAGRTHLDRVLPDRDVALPRHRAAHLAVDDEDRAGRVGLHAHEGPDRLEPRRDLTVATRRDLTGLAVLFV